MNVGSADPARLNDMRSQARGHRRRDVGLGDNAHSARGPLPTVRGHGGGPQPTVAQVTNLVLQLSEPVLHHVVLLEHYHLGHGLAVAACATRC